VRPSRRTKERGEITPKIEKGGTLERKKLGKRGFRKGKEE